MISLLEAGGAERVMSELANAMAARGDEITLVTLAGAGGDRYRLDPRVKRVALELRSDSNSIVRAIASNYRRIRALRAAIRASGAAAVLVFEERANVLVILATMGLGVRRVISERVDPRSHAIGAAWRALRRLAYPLADALVVQTQALERWARGAMLGRRVEVIPNPLRALPRCDEATRTHTIVAVGRLVQQKGHHVLLRAFARVSHEAPAWNLVILGEGEERAALEQLARDLGIAERVSFRGWVAEPADVLCTAGVYAMPSRYEGFPNALLDAMACGLPAVCTAWAGAGEMITHEVDGLLVPVDDVEALAAALRRLVHDPALRERLGKSALAVRERFSMPAVLRQWDRVLAPERRRD